MGSGFGVRGSWLGVYGVKGQGLGVGGRIFSATVDALLGAQPHGRDGKEVCSLPLMTEFADGH